MPGMTGLSYSADAAANVLHALIVPSLNPVMNQRLRCSAEPWVKLSGTTVPWRFALQRVVADRRRGLQRGVDIARIEETLLTFGMVGPDAGEAVGLQLDADLQAVDAALSLDDCCACCTFGRMPSRFCT